MIRTARQFGRRLVVAARGFLDAWIGGSSVTAPMGANLTGVHVSERNLLTLVGAYACINRIATDLSWLPIGLYRKRRIGQGTDEIRDDPRVELVSATPDDGESTAIGQRYTWVANCLGWGTGYLRVYRDGKGLPVYLEIIDPAGIEPRRRSDDGGLFYKLTTGGTLPADEVIPLGLLGPDGIHGYSPVRLHRQAVALGLAQEGFGASFYGNAATPRVVLSHPTTLTEGAATRIEKRMDECYSGVDQAHRTLVLEEGIKVQNLTMNPVDAQYIAGRRFQLQELARIYGVPLNKLMEHSDANYATVEANNLDYSVNTITPYGTRIEAVYNLRLLTQEERRAGYYWKININALLRGDMAARSTFYRNLFYMGTLSPNEIRALEDMNPIDGGGDEYFVPTNLGPLDLIGAGLTSPNGNTQGNGNGNRAKIFTNGFAR